MSTWAYDSNRGSTLTNVGMFGSMLCRVFAGELFDPICTNKWFENKKCKKIVESEYITIVVLSSIVISLG